MEVGVEDFYESAEELLADLTFGGWVIKYQQRTAENRMCVCVRVPWHYVCMYGHELSRPKHNGAERDPMKLIGTFRLNAILFSTPRVLDAIQQSSVGITITSSPVA